MAQRVDPRRVRATLSWPLVISDGEVQLRRLDLMNLVLTGRFEARTLLAAQRMEEVLLGIGPRGALGEDAVLQLDTIPHDERDAFVEVLRLYACAAIADPVYTMEDDGDERHVPVATLSVPDLLAIWVARPPAGVALDPQQPLAAPQGVGATERFPEAAAVPDRAEPEPAERDDAPPRVENVAVQTFRAADDRVVEFAQG